MNRLNSTIRMFNKLSNKMALNNKHDVTCKLYELFYESD